MIRWFKRKKKKDQGEVQNDIRENIEQKEELQDEEVLVDETGVEIRTPGAGAAEEPEPESETLPPEAAEEEETWEEEDETWPEEEGAGEESAPKRGFFRRLRQRLKGTRQKFVHRIDRLVLGKKVIDEDLLDELEEILITSDLGVKTTAMLLRKVADKVKRKELSDPARLMEHIREEIRGVLSVEAPVLDYRAHKPLVVMIVGVNGTGKTTTTGKLANQLKLQGLKPMLVAGDTFRAAAVEQLSIWGERVGVPVIKQKSGSDPSAVVFDALDAAVSRDIDVVLMDTAGRMHTKVNLMEELKKIHRVINKKMPDAPHEVFLVLDASTGQNALSQAKLFKEQIGLTGLILTKLDGTAKGGIIAAICEELQIPVRYIGIGESIDDLRPFDPEEFTNALF
ncbi:MAG: signal recognition particle-docking protein FtsY [Syntrophobacteraceae bacterium]